MDHIQGTDRDQLTLFPEALDDYISKDNPVRFIDAFVDSLDLQDLGFTHAVPAETSRPQTDSRSIAPACASCGHRGASRRQYSAAHFSREISIGEFPGQYNVYGSVPRGTLKPMVNSSCTHPAIAEVACVPSLPSM